MRAAMTPTECMRCLASLPFPSIPVGLQLDTDTLLGACVAANTDALAGTYPSAGRGSFVLVV